jgi:RNA polymerase sigma-70 factor, ECF subfamily
MSTTSSLKPLKVAGFGDPRDLSEESPQLQHPSVGLLPNRSQMDEINDEGDVQLVTRRDPCRDMGLAELYRQHAEAVYVTARRVLHNTTEAEDVTQDVFLRLWKQPERFDPNRGTLRAFLQAQAHARSVDAVRTLNARRRRESGHAYGIVDAEYDILHEFWALVRADHLSRALGELPDDERQAIELAYFDGRTYVEVAELLHEPEGTIKSRIRNGMRRMRVVLVEAGIQGIEA